MFVEGDGENGRKIWELQATAYLQKHYSVESKFEHMRKIAPITIKKPLPNMNVQPGVQLIEQIDMKEYFELADPTNYLELSMKLIKGSAVPGWLTLSRGRLSNPQDIFLGGSASAIKIEGS